MNKHIAYTQLSSIAVGLLLSVAACHDEQPLSQVAEGTPLVITASIGSTAGTTRAADASNAYDRTEFINADAIRIICTRGDVQLASSGYTLNTSTGSWSVSNNETALGFLPATSCQATFPVGADGSIQANQQETSGFLKSNYLRTPSVPVTGAELNFTGNNAFEHVNAKLTLKFVGKNKLPAFRQLTVQAAGLRTGTATTENISMLRPVANEYTWCAVINPKNAATAITITVTDANNVTYTTTVSCGMAPNTSYTYTLTLKNNILVPVGNAEIKAWQVEPRHNGDFDTV